MMTINMDILTARNEGANDMPVKLDRTGDCQEGTEYNRILVDVNFLVVMTTAAGILCNEVPKDVALIEIALKPDGPVVCQVEVTTDVEDEQVLSTPTEHQHLIALQVDLGYFNDIDASIAADRNNRLIVTNISAADLSEHLGRD